MAGHETGYYDRAWRQIAGHISPQEETRISATLRLIPSDCTSILDVGCGDGRITNFLAQCGHTVVGLDTSAEALRHVGGTRVAASVGALPFSSKSFDLVLCSEVLEHLPHDVYAKALLEVSRVASWFALITVPNAQDLKASLVTCPHCHCRFNPSRHVRSFSRDTMAGLLPGYSLETMSEIVPSDVYPRIAGTLWNRVVGIHDAFPSTAICPQCGYMRTTDPAGDREEPITAKRPRLACIIRHALPFLKRAAPHQVAGIWLLALYRRLDATPGH